jgi:serine/threonine protein kinase/WD40 repeat protein
MAIDAARAKSLFLAASDLADPAARAAFLDRECGRDAELRARVEALLRAIDAAPLPSTGAATVDSAPGQPETTDYGDPTARVGAVLAGKYKLVEAIGEGGMGSVFMAQQIEPVKRTVAVKVIKAGMDSRAVLARFEAERQALAMMDHPNIAKVLDAGSTDGGRPFFVMELVRGTPITRYCDEHKLTPRQRLELFVPVCQAIQHAHQKGIIHRDIKPSNVLVAMYDDRAVPKVIDFGVAKAAGQTLTDKTLMTGFGAMVGTPEYMSPEQASLNNLDIDTRSDVYSLGVLLYELLTGTTPVDKKSLGQAALLEILRIVREVEAPRPSAKLSIIDTLPSVAANRGTEPAKLSRLMRGELDWLVMKALEKDRTRRYETANGLARDIQRYLADEVVEARPPSVRYRVGKFLRKHRAGALTGTAFLLLLLAAVAVSSWLAMRATDAEGEAIEKRNEAVKTSASLRVAQDELRSTLYAAQASLIQHAWDANDLVRVRDLLRRQLPRAGERDVRGFEWFLWDRRAHAETRVVPLAGSGSSSTTRIALSPDGSRAVGWGRGLNMPGRIGGRYTTVWNTSTGEALVELVPDAGIPGFQGLYDEPKFDASGTRILQKARSAKPPAPSKPLDLVMVAWDAASGKRLFTIRDQFDGSFGMPQYAVSPDGQRLAAVLGTRLNKEGAEVLKVWDTSTARELYARREPPGTVQAIAFSPDSARLVVAVRAGGAGNPETAIKVVTSADGKEGRILGKVPGTLKTVGPARSLVFSPDGNRVAADAIVAGSAQLYLLDGKTGQTRMVLSRPYEVGESCVFSSDERLLAIYGGREVALYHAGTGAVLRVLKGHAGNATSAKFSGDSQRLITVGDDCTVRVWPATASDAPIALGDTPFGRHSFAVAADGTRIAAITDPDGGVIATSVHRLNAAASEVKVWDTQGRQLFALVLQLEPGTEREAAFPRVALSADGRRVAAIRRIGGRGAEQIRQRPELRVWDVDTGKQLFFLGSQELGHYIALSPDGTRVAAVTAQAGWGLKLWDVASGRQLQQFATGKSPSLTPAFSPDGERLAAILTTHERPQALKVWQVATGEELLTVPDRSGRHSVAARALAFSADGQRIVWAQAGMEDLGLLAPMQASVIEVATGKELAVLSGFAGPVAHLCSSPDGRRIVSVETRNRNMPTSLGEVKVWDAGTGSNLLSLHWDRAVMHSACFGSDGRHLITVGLSNRGYLLKVWDGTPR